MRRVAILTHEFRPHRGGIGRVAEGLAEGAVEMGLRPVVVAPDYHQDNAEVDGDLPYPVRRFPGRNCSMVSPRQLVQYARRLDGILPELEPDLVHAVCPASQMALTALSRLGRVGRAFAFTVHGTELLRYRKELLLRLWMFRGFHRPVGVTVVSHTVRRLLLRDFSAPTERIFVSHPGIAPTWHRSPKADREAVRSGWEARPEDFVVLTVARRVPAKGQDRVIAGIVALPEALRKRTLYVVAGPGPEGYARSLGKLAAEGGVRLRLLGELTDEDLVDACDSADLFAMLSRATPKRLEGLGLTYLEAGRRGLPSLACDTGGVSEAVRDGETGLLLPADAGPEETASGLRRFQEDHAFRRRAREEAERWGRRFTYGGHAREVYGRFGALMSGAPLH